MSAWTGSPSSAPHRPLGQLTDETRQDTSIHHLGKNNAKKTYTHAKSQSISLVSSRPTPSRSHSVTIPKIPIQQISSHLTIPSLSQPKPTTSEWPTNECPSSSSPDFRPRRSGPRLQNTHTTHQPRELQPSQPSS
ncbi:hypothetical protein VTJ04DRAFT_2423 [Mycothermus thermophilus]|uniref:uncharacterized protein n=1 Tax=Humicola insolens TaxID=85995 RepID=UPI0037448FA6